MADDRRALFDQLLADAQEAVREVDRLARVSRVVAQENLPPLTVDETSELQAALGKREGAQNRLVEFLEGGLPKVK
jgi:uncharacterized membrane protein